MITEFDDEPVHGLPTQLADGERLLWQGSPEWGGLAREAFRVRAVAIYFALFALWRGGGAVADGAGFLGALSATTWTVVPAALAIGVLLLLARAYSRATVYTLTSERIVIRSGIALTMAVDIPFNLVEGAALRSHGDGSGDLVLRVSSKQRLSWVILWPNVRPWKFARPEAMLRAIPEASLVSALLARALRHHAGQTDAPAPAPLPATARTNGTFRPATA